MTPANWKIDSAMSIAKKIIRKMMIQLIGFFIMATLTAAIYAFSFCFWMKLATRPTSIKPSSAISTTVTQFVKFHVITTGSITDTPQVRYRSGSPYDGPTGVVNYAKKNDRFLGISKPFNIPSSLGTGANICKSFFPTS